MTELETKHSEVAEVPTHQQSDENDARVLHGLGYNQELSVSAVTTYCTPNFVLTEYQRKFGLWSSLGLTTTVMATCEFCAVGGTQNPLILISTLAQGKPTRSRSQQSLLMEVLYGFPDSRNKLVDVGTDFAGSSRLP